LNPPGVDFFVGCDNLRILKEGGCTLKWLNLIG
jgi:hypothetical protein